MSSLSFKNINKIYPNGVQAVYDFNLEIKDKEFIVFVGPSGCGKSTTLRMVAGLEDITYGNLYIDEKLVNAVAPKDRNIAMVFQSYALYPHMTVFGNMAFALKMRKIPCQVYEKNDDILPLKEEMKAIYKEVAKINREFKKKQNSDDLIPQRLELYQKLYALDNKIHSMLKPIVGIDERQIKEINKQIASVNKQIAEEHKLYDKYAATDEEGAKSVLQSIEHKNNLVKEYTERVEYLKKTPVEIKTPRYLTKQEIDLEVNKVAESIDLVKYLFRKPAALSGGQRQRVALGRAIVRKPKVFLMDEPLSNLDAKLRVQTRSEISKIHKAVGATTIYVTHDQTEAMTMADRIVVMKDGYIQQIGTPEELYHDPANKFVGGFIGSPAMNFVKGRVVENDFVILQDKEEIKIGLSKEQVSTLKNHSDKEIYLGIRPESLYLAGDKNNESPTNNVKCEVDFVELLGYELIIYTYFLGQRVIFKTNCKNKIKTGDKIDINLNSKELYFFDAETEQRIK